MYLWNSNTQQEKNEDGFVPESSISRAKDENKPSTTVIALSVVLSVVAVGLVVAVGAIVKLRRKINRQT